MYCSIGRRSELHRMFSGLVQNVFQAEVGLCDPQVTDYLAQMLTEFVHVDDVFRLHDIDGHAIREISKMRAVAQLGPEIDDHERQRCINRYIGDFTLFWTGVYPEQLRLKRRGGDPISRFVVEGKRSYGIASELSRPDERPPAALLRQLSAQFETCVHGLHLVRENWASSETLDDN
jgi:hypothetical protein